MRVYRKLLPGEAHKLAAHLDRLAREELLSRFMGAVGHAGVHEHCERIDWFRTVVIGFFEAGVMHGAAEVHVADHKFPMLCEVAVAVETQWQDQGVGTELVRRALVIARNRAARGLRITCFIDNHRVQHIARKFGARFHSSAGEAEADIAIPAPNCFSFCEEALDTALGWISLCCEPSAEFPDWWRALARE